MQKFFKRLKNQIKRIIENVKKGSVVDIAIVFACTIFALSVVILGISALMQRQNSGDDISLSLQESGTVNSSSLNDTSDKNTNSQITPFGPQGSQSGNTQNNNAQSGNSQSSTSASTSASSSSSATTPAPTPAPSSSSSSSSTSQSEEVTPIYGEPVWHGPCNGPYEVRTATNVDESHPDYEIVTDLPAQDHDFDTLPAEIILNDEGEQIYTRYVCNTCGAIWNLEYKPDGESNSTDSG